MRETQISIIMPAYNAAKYIGHAIESVLSQTYEYWQLIIVDDGSTDATLRIAQEYANRDEKKRIIVIHQNNSGTAAAARNTALEYVTGEYVQILDSDDYISQDCLQKCAYAIQQNNNIPQIILPVVYSVKDDGIILGEISQVSKYVGKRISGEEAFVLSLDWIIHGWMCVSASILKSIRFDTLLINGDELTTRKLFANASLVEMIDGIYYYRDNLNSTTKTLKNRYRMHESLTTDSNIYFYSVECKMQTSIISKCAEKWMKSIIAHEAHYLREKNFYTDEECAYVSNIIASNLKRATNEKVYANNDSIWGNMIRICNADMQRLRFFARIYNILWKIKNKRKDKGKNDENGIG